METNTEDQAGTQYVVRVGGEDVSVTKGEGEDAKTYSYYEAVITVTTTVAGTTVEYEEIIAGDVNGYGGADDEDAAHILTASVFGLVFGQEYLDEVYNIPNETMIGQERITETGETYYIGDVNGYGGTDDEDAAHILTASVFGLVFGQEYLDEVYNTPNETMIGQSIMVEVIE